LVTSSFFVFWGSARFNWNFTTFEKWVSAKFCIVDRKFSFTHCWTKRFGAVITIWSGVLFDKSSRNGLIQVLNCWELSSFEKYQKHELQKVSAVLIVILFTVILYSRFSSAIIRIHSI
jgi:hypothetical protein